MNEYTLLRIWGYHLNINHFIDSFANYTVEQDYHNMKYVPGKGYVVTMCVYIKETKYTRIDELATYHKVAYCGTSKTGGNCVPSNIKLDSRNENVLAVLKKLEEEKAA